MNTRAILIVFTAAIASLLEIIDTSIVNVSIPTMMGNLGATLDEISWVSTGYMIANSIILPISAWLGARFGRKNYFTAAIAIFTIASFACGTAPNLGFLILFRVIQGLAGGALLPTSQTLMQEQFPPEKAGMAMAIFGMSVMVGPALGPTLGGYLTDNFGWRSIFNVNVPVGILAGLLSWSNVYDAKGSEEASERAKKSGVDWWGLFFLVVGVGCFQYILERGQADQWFDSKVIRACAFLSIVGVISFIYWELKIKNPIMNLRLFKLNIVRTGSLLMLMLGVLLYSLTFVVPIFVSTVIPNMSATQTGMLFIPGALATAACMIPVGKLLQWVSPKVLVVVGLIFGEASLLSMAHLTNESGTYNLFVPLLLRGISSAFLFVPINQMVLGSVTRQQLPEVASMQNFFRQVGGSIGISSLDTLITRFSAQNYNDLMAHVNALNPGGMQAFIQSQGMIGSRMASALGMWTPDTLATRALHSRALLQTFLMSFGQLCWVIMCIVALGVLPLIFIKPKTNKGGPIMDAH
jgi:MFS transporter, DHA2 family, multidrug resistance protein